jgi:NAD(P)H-flavin reductase/ferredoxin
VLRRIQRAGQWVFLRIESAFNLAFGDELNPLYYLGPIAYYLLWIVVVSGLYLYAFFKTGVDEAYASVEQLTHAQWYLGGVMRSLHRYASAGLVLAMVLHLLRHFTFDHYRSFRWFSWWTGIALLWLTFAAGINGYMLPWDDLGQFVAVATAEWFDRLPVFGGVLVRNFIFPGAVNDRLFSLLSFIHIGVPLAILALLWIHTQRVPHARTSPPRSVMATLLLALVVLALLKPATSGGPADLSRAPGTIRFDWFYLAVYPLIYSWSTGKVWLLVAGGTLLLLALPWLPPMLGFRRGRVFHALMYPDNRIVAVREGESILDAALRENLSPPYECRGGGCGVCKAKVLYGTVDYGVYQPDALSEAEKRDGKALLCCATPLSDVEVEYQPVAALGGVPARVYSARVEKLNRLSEDVMQLFLRLPVGEKLRFYAGQHINVLLEGGAKRSFSFATAPAETDLIELHIRWIKGGLFTSQVFTAMKEGDVLRFEGPLGSFFLREESGKPIVFVAGATGFAPVKSMLEYAFSIGAKRKMALYWGVRSLRDLYLGDLPRQWEREHSNFRFVPVLSEPRPEDAWQGRTGLVHEAILTDYPDLSGHQIYACGSVQMIQAAHPAFVAQGMSEDDCFSDAFRLAPHQKVTSAQADMVRLGGTP